MFVFTVKAIVFHPFSVFSGTSRGICHSGLGVRPWIPQLTAGETKALGIISAFAQGPRLYWFNPQKKDDDIDDQLSPRRLSPLNWRNWTSPV
jgi:hypothetical protein